MADSVFPFSFRLSTKKEDARQQKSQPIWQSHISLFKRCFGSVSAVHFDASVMKTRDTYCNRRGFTSDNDNVQFHVTKKKVN